MLPLYIKSPNSYLSQGNFTKPFIDQKPTKLLKNLQLHKERNQVSLFYEASLTMTTKFSKGFINRPNQTLL